MVFAIKGVKWILKPAAGTGDTSVSWNTQNLSWYILHLESNSDVEAFSKTHYLRFIRLTLSFLIFYFKGYCP